MALPKLRPDRSKLNEIHESICQPSDAMVDAVIELILCLLKIFLGRLGRLRCLFAAATRP